MAWIGLSEENGFRSNSDCLAYSHVAAAIHCMTNIIALWPVPNHTRWWQRHVCANGVKWNCRQSRHV